MVSHTIMIMTYVLTIGQVQTLQPVAVPIYSAKRGILPQHWPKVSNASLSRATCDDDVLTKSSPENPIPAIHGHFFLNCMASWACDAL